MIVARKIIVSPGHRFSCDVHAEELKITENGAERDPTMKELHEMMNGHRVFIGKPLKLFELELAKAEMLRRLGVDAIPDGIVVTQIVADDPDKWINEMNKKMENK